MRLDLQQLRDTAKGATCKIESPACTGGTETTVWCHGNLQAAGKGMGIKAEDVIGAHGCAGCNWWLDQSGATFEDKFKVLIRGMTKTYMHLFTTGQLRVFPAGAVEITTSKPRLKRKSKGSTLAPSKIVKHPGVL